MGLGHSSILLPFVFLIVVTLALMCPLLSARRSLPAIRPTLNNRLRSPKAAPALLVPTSDPLERRAGNEASSGPQLTSWNRFARNGRSLQPFQRRESA